MHKTLSDWLVYIEQLHPKAIAMGLERANQIIAYLALKPNFKIITVGGTNGKGSTCAMLAHMYVEAGYRVGCYTSPHLLHYNERVTVNLAHASDADLCLAFAHIEEARQALNIQLTYFEVGTLAAIWHFTQSHVDIAVLEVGLGGRLDTVNAFDTDCAIVTSIDLDHQEYLGDTRELIAAEKAAIYRPNKPAICGDVVPPISLVAYAQKISAQAFYRQQDFKCEQTPEHPNVMQFECPQASFTLPIPALFGRYQLNNAACALMAVASLADTFPVPLSAMANAMEKVKLPGRFQTIHTNPNVTLDVAHNPHAAKALAENLSADNTHDVTTIAVFAMLADKDTQGVIEILEPYISVWNIAPIDHVRGAKASDLQASILKVNPNSQTHTFASIVKAYQSAFRLAETHIANGENVKIIVFGSFFTVANVLQIENDLDYSLS